MELREYLKTSKRSRRALSDSIGVHYMHLSNIIRGARRPSPSLALRIEEATGGQVTRLELLYPEQKPKMGLKNDIRRGN